MQFDNPVFILESPGAQDLPTKRSEANILEESLRLLNVPTISLRVLCSSDLATAARVFRQINPRILHVSGHGTTDGQSLCLTDGSVCGWSELLESFPFVHPDSYLVASACSSLRNDHLAGAFKACRSHAPSAVIGFYEPVTWAQASTASVILYQSLRVPAQHDIYAAMMAAYIAIGVDFAAYRRNTNGEITRLTGSALLHEFCLSLVRRDRKAFETLVTERGLLSPDWTQMWDQQDRLRKRLEKAMAAVDANPIASAAVRRAEMEAEEDEPE